MLHSPITGTRAPDRIPPKDGANPARDTFRKPRSPDRNASTANEAARENTTCLRLPDRAWLHVQMLQWRRQSAPAFDRRCRGCTRPVRFVVAVAWCREERRALQEAVGCSTAQCLHSIELR